MVQINFAKREINCKLVYYGPGLSGKTTNLEVVHKKAPASKKGELTSIATEGDRTLFFDYMPLELGTVGGMKTKFQLYTVPGQVYYNATRKLVLQGADGVVFVADSKRDKMKENLESYKNLEENLREQGLELKDLPHVIQYNKRDLPEVYTVEELEKDLNEFGVPTFEACAIKDDGVFPTLRKLALLVLEKLNKEYGFASEGSKDKEPEKKAEPAPAEPVVEVADRPTAVEVAEQEAAKASPPAAPAPAAPARPAVAAAAEAAPAPAASATATQTPPKGQPAAVTAPAPVAAPAPAPAPSRGAAAGGFEITGQAGSGSDDDGAGGGMTAFILLLLLAVAGGGAYYYYFYMYLPGLEQ